MRKLNGNFFIMILSFLGFINGFSQATELPLLQIEALEYEGAFLIPGGIIGESNIDYTTGAMAYNSATNSMFVAGLDEDGSLAEFTVPSLVNSTDVGDLNTAAALQNFRKVLNINSNPENIDRLTGLYLFNDKLIVHGMVYYDADAEATNTTIVIDDASDIANSAVSDYYSLEGAAHTSGWISDIPSEWQTLLGGTHITGNSSFYAINSRLPMGPTAFLFDPSDLTGTPTGTVATTSLLDYSLDNPLYADFSAYEDALYNVVSQAADGDSSFEGHTAEDAKITVGDNDLWTDVSQASYGFIVPNTRTYLTIGASGGHESGIGYKAGQDNSSENPCGGPCPYSSSDRLNYYWLWDVNDLLSVKNGSLEPYEVRPYAYGEFNPPFQTDVYTDTPELHNIIGGTYDAASNLLYLTIEDGGTTGPYGEVPVIVAYNINTEALSINEEDFNETAMTVYPNPAKDRFTFSLEDNVFQSLAIYNSLGQKVKESKQTEVDISTLAVGAYFIRFNLQNKKPVYKSLVKEK